MINLGEECAYECYPAPNYEYIPDCPFCGGKAGAWQRRFLKGTAAQLEERKAVSR